MTETEAFVHSIFMTSGKGLTPLIVAIDQTAKLLYREQRRAGEIQVTKDVYPAVAESLHTTPRTAARQILRTAHNCWHRLSDAQKLEYIGRVFPELDAPRDLLFFLAAYIYTGRPYFAQNDTPK